jgi:hypothetical protein
VPRLQDLIEQMNVNDKVSIKLDTHGTPAENLQRLITDCGVSPHKVSGAPRSWQ